MPSSGKPLVAEKSRSLSKASSVILLSFLPSGYKILNKESFMFGHNDNCYNNNSNNEKLIKVWTGKNIFALLKNS